MVSTPFSSMVYEAVPTVPVSSAALAVIGTTAKRLTTIIKASKMLTGFLIFEIIVNIPPLDFIG
jgi:hypothetical protein